MVYRGGYGLEEGLQADRQLREQIADKLSEIEKKISAEIDNAELSELAEIEKNRKKLNNLKDLIKYSPYGASAFFSDSAIKESELEGIYKMDLDVLDSVEKLESDIETYNISDIKISIQKTEESINKRNQYLKER